MAKFCPQCEESYQGDDLETCPDDGARLFVRSNRPDDPLVGTVLDDRFRIERPLSEGGMGAVYLATQLSVDRSVALKVVKPGLEDEGPFLDRFFREARVIADLSHPNIVRLVDFGQDRDRDVIYLVMELVDGIELGELLTRGRLDPALALEVVDQLSAGLTEPHSREIVHRDLKPANIILLPSSDGTCQVKLVDFGIVRTAEADTRLTETGMICGTPAYLSPEQARNMEVDDRTDLYSLGVVLFEMLTGHLPFDGPSGLQMLMKHVQREAPALAASYPEAIPPQLGSLVADLMAKSPDDRPDSARRLRRRVRDLRDRLDISEVLLEDDDGDIEDIEGRFATWMSPDLDPGRLDHPPDNPSSEIAHAETRDTPADDIAHTETRDTPADDIAHARTRQAPPDSEADDALQSPAPSGGSESGTPESDDPDDAKPPTAPVEKRDSELRGVLLGAFATIAIIATVALAVVTTSLLDDTPDAPSDDPGDHRPVDEVTQADEIHQPEERDRADDPTDQPDEQPTDDEPAEQPADPDQQETDPQETDDETPRAERPAAPVEADDSQAVAEAVEPDPGQPTEPGAAQPPVPSGDEPTSSDEISGPTHRGTLVLETDEDAEDAARYAEVTGDLIVRVTDSSSLELPRLQIVGGNLMVGPQSRIAQLQLPQLKQLGGGLILSEAQHLESLQAPQLQAIGRHMQLSSTPLHELQLPDLQRVDAAIQVTDTPALSVLKLPRIQQVGGGLSVMQNPGMHTVEMPRLRAVGAQLQILSGELDTVALPELTTVGGAVTFHDNTNLQTVDLGELTTVATSSADGGMTFHDTTRLENLDVSSLERVGDSLTLNNLTRLDKLNFQNLRDVDDSITLSDNEAVETIDLTNLASVDGDLLVNNHRSLRQLSLENLHDVGDLSVMNSPRLAPCDLQAVADSMKADGWTGEYNVVNVDDGAC